jgi:type IV secretion system protein VirB9
VIKFNLWRVAACAVLAMAGVSSVFAEVRATPLAGDTRLVQFQFDADQTYLVLAKPKAVTHIQFGTDELIQSVAAGDTANWELTPTKNRKNLFVKPKFEDQETSLTVITDLRTYQFVLRSTGEGKKWHQRINWIYPQEVVLDLAGVDSSAASKTQAAAITLGATAADPGLRLVTEPTGLKPEALRFRYEIQGDAPFRPTVVFDDGRFTYIKMPSGLQELPALFAVIDGSDYALVNFEVKGDYLVAQRVVEKAVLKLGRTEVKINAAPVQAKRSFLGLQLGS